MNILQICNRVPFPPMDGGTIAMFNIFNGLKKEGHQVHVFALNTNKHPVPTETFKGNSEITIQNIDTSVNFLSALFNLFSDSSYNISRFYSKKVELKLIKLLETEKFDIVQLESLYVCPYINCIRKHTNAKIILRAHNVEHYIWKRITHHSKNIFKKIYLSLLTKKLKKYELSIINEVDAIAAITLTDSTIFRTLGSLVPIYVIPFGIELTEYKYESPAENFYLFHLGSMDWLPNIEGIDWFLNNCWEKINKEIPEAKLFIGGRNISNKYFQIKLPNVEVAKKVDDAREFMKSKKIMIVPLLSGSGVRVKIIEGMALGKTVISTSIGAEGIEYTANENILIANSVEDFVKQIKFLYFNPSFSSIIGQNAMNLVKEKYDNKTIIKNLISFYFQVLGIEQRN